MSLVARIKARQSLGCPVVFGLVAGLYLVFHLPWLASIPGYTFDEGLLGLVAKNWITLGDPLFGHNLDLLRFPLYTTLLAGAYSLLGHSILVSRLLSVVAGLAALAVFAKVAHRLVPKSAAWFAILMYAVDFVLVRYQRYGLAESVQILLLLSVVALWLRPGGGGRLLRGIVLAAAILQKPTSLYIVPALLWLDWQAVRGSQRSYVQAGSRPAARRLIVPYLAAVMVVGVVHCTLWIVWPRQFIDAWSIYVHQPLQLSDMLRSAGILLISSPVAVLGTLVLPFRLRKGADRGTRFLCVWLALGLLFLGLQRVHPVRYYATLIPPALLAGGLLLDSFAAAIARHWKRDGSWEGAAHGIRAALGAVIVIYAATAFVIYYFALGHRDQSAREVSAWIKTHVPESCTVLGFPHLGVDIPHRYVEATSAGALLASKSVLASQRVDYVLYDDVEWRALSDSKGWGVEDSLRTHCKFCDRVGRVEVWRVIEATESTGKAPAAPGTTVLFERARCASPWFVSS
jgi:4-amino-4-deoxy-L-arabinose transferase-like glycosyltransferase